MLRAPVIFLALTFSFHLTAAKKPVTVESVVNSRPRSDGPVVWAPDGERFIINDRGTLDVYDIRSGKERAVIPLELARLVAVAAEADSALSA